MVKPIVTSVSLDAETKEISKTMPNFSSFVRTCLIRWRNEQISAVYTHRAPRTVGTYTVCYPFASNGLCVLCWPDGSPTMEDWKLFMHSNPTSGLSYANSITRQYNPMSLTDLKIKAKNTDQQAQFHMTKFNFKRLNAKTDQGRKPRLGYVKRVILAFLNK